MNKTLYCLVLIILFTLNASAEVIFSDDFDDQADWVPDCLVCGNDYDGYSGDGASVGTPEGWDYWSNYEWWNQYASSPTATANPTVRISGDSHMGTTGKSLICTQESNVGTGDNYGADGVLMKYIPVGRDEIYVRFFINYQSDFVRHWIAAQNATMIKTFRVMHWDGDGSVHTYFTNGYSAPIALVQVGQNEYYGGNANLSVRCDPQETAYSSDTTITRGVFRDINGDVVTGWSTVSPDDSMIGSFSADWHEMIFHVKKNSAIGVADGEYHFYQNGVLVASRINIEWIKSGGDINANWNMIAFGGNAFNNYLGITDHTFQPGAEQYYAIDSIVIATTLQEAIDGPTGPTYDPPIVTGPNDFSTTESSVEIEGTYTVDTDLSDQSVIVTWTLGGNSGFAVAALGVFSCTIPNLQIGNNTIAINITDSQNQSITDYITVNRTIGIMNTTFNGGIVSGCIIK